MKKVCGSDKRLANRIGGVTERTVNAWLHKPEDELRRLQPDNLAKILSVSKELGIQPELLRGPELWDDQKDFHSNLTFDPGLPPTNSANVQAHNVTFLGISLTSPFGASASILTSNSLRVRFLAHAGCDVITFKTIRSKSCDPHPVQNILYCTTGETIDPERKMQTTRTVAISRKGFDPKRGMVNRFGMPCLQPSIVEQEFQAAKRELRVGQLLILSVAGSAEKTDPRSVLIKDFRQAVVNAIKAEADVIELNLSCPNCNGLEGEVYRDLELTLAICKQASSLAKGKRLLLKLGYMSREHLKRFINATSPYVHGYSLINSMPIKAMLRGQTDHETVPAFAGLKCGLSGGPIFPCGLRSVEWAAATIRAEGMHNIGLIGMGGVTEPAHVKMYLDAGADVVQSTTALYYDSFFGIKVRNFLDSELLSRKLTGDEEREIARMNWSRAIRQLEAEMSQSQHGPLHLDEAAILEFREWERAHDKALTLGPRRASAIPTVEEFKERIKNRVA
jgi:dihydroorotate dehydrogenase